MSTLIVPICGKSERFNIKQPKWSIRVNTHKTYEIDDITYLLYPPMLLEAVQYLGRRDIHLIYRLEDQDYLDQVLKYRKFFPTDSLSFTLLKHQTKNQVETIRESIESTNISGPIMIKDCDNVFIPMEFCQGNFVAYSPLEGVVFNPEAKSYIQLNDHNEVVNVVEKKVISDKFCCGLYGFAHADQFLYYSDGCEYVSQVILKMLLAKEKFVGVKCTSYKDFGTRESYEYFTGNKL